MPPESYESIISYFFPNVHSSREFSRGIRSRGDTCFDYGLSDSDFRTAIECGISKINIFTDLNLAQANGAREALAEGKTAITSDAPRRGARGGKEDAPFLRPMRIR